ncbi:MAG: gliding motility-associated lipoprotein [Marinilabiliales bacterium]|nr:MAG: gliding motility-associated lipoprotein [Marinilabiliales bacterium]
MKTLKFFSLGLLFLSLFNSCSNWGNGELIGVQNREPWYEPDPYGMIYVPMGSYNMGPNDQDVSWAMTAEAKTVSIHPFWMDQTEITNNEYRQFVYWVRDSIAKVKLAENGLDQHKIEEDAYGNTIDPYFLNWDESIYWKGEDERDILDEMYLPEHERFYRRKEIDTRKLMFTYYWIDLKQAAKKYDFEGKKRRSYDYDNQKYNETHNGENYVTNWSVEKNPDGIRVDRSNVGKKVPVESRKTYIMMDVINVYPDTLCWMSDFTYSYNDPATKMYFWHPAYDHYPVVGVSWKQATAFSVWRTQLLNGTLSKWGEQFVQDYRLPTESEWEYAARGGLRESMYPWGGYYTRNMTGCFVANFKPLRGNYMADGGFYPVIVGINDPNAYGLYDMAGNVAEWTSNAFDEAAYSYTDDLNPDYQYDARPTDPPALKRKVIRGGSWKDIAYYLQCGSRTYEYQDTAKSYIGFRCVRTFLGRERNDSGGSQVY